MNAAALDMARGACPALDAPMQTGDGLLSRMALMDWISPRDLAEICKLSIRHGNGILDISQRGNLQVRGLTAESAISLEVDIRSLNLPLREGLAVEWTPLAGMEPGLACDPRPLGRLIIDHASALRGRLAPKLSIVLDAGGAVGFDDLLADIRLTAQRNADALCWEIRLGGTAEKALRLGLVAEADAPSLVALLLNHMAERGSKVRGRDLAPGSLPASAMALVKPGTNKAPLQKQASLGLLNLSGSLGALRIGLPFGQQNANVLAEFCEYAKFVGIDRVQPAPNHTLILVGETATCALLLKTAKTSGFITESDDALSAIDACSGRPACRSASLCTHELGRFAAAEMPDLFDGSLRLHLSGCAKGCAHPTASTLTFVGTETGSRLVFCGKTTDTAVKQLAPHKEKAALASLTRLIGAERKSGETNHDCLTRLGSERIAAALDEGH